MRTKTNIEPLNESSCGQFIRLLMLNDKRIYAYILSVVPIASDADDIMQETCSVMWQKFSNFKPDMDFVAWAITVARYQILAHLKRKKRSKVHYSDSLMDHLQDQLVQKMPEMDDRLDALKQCVGKLPEDDRRILQMRYESGYTLQNIGAYVSKSTRATYYALLRIHSLLLHCVNRSMTGETQT